MPKLSAALSAIGWQMLLMGLLGLSGVVFVPLLLHSFDSGLMAKLLVVQVNVYYLVVLLLYGFAWSGPAELAKKVSPAHDGHLLVTAVRAKLLLLVPTLLVFGVVCTVVFPGDAYLWAFALLLLASALNSNWFLQAKQNFAAGAGYAALGVVLSASLLYLLFVQQEWVDSASLGLVCVLVLLLPHICVGLGSWYAARQSCQTVQTKKVTFADCQRILRKDWPLVISQLLLLASTTLGTVFVGAFAESDVTVAYAAIEKLFNLGATVLVGLYMALHPRFAKLYHEDRAAYWKSLQFLVVAYMAGGIGLAMFLNLMGDKLFGFYLPAHLLVYALPALVPFALWLGLCIVQHALIGYLVFAGRQTEVLWVNAGVLLVTIGAGYLCMLANPVAWVYGMLIGQIFVMFLLLKIRNGDKVVIA